MWSYTTETRSFSASYIRLSWQAIERETNGELHLEADLQRDGTYNDSHQNKFY